MNTFNKLNNRAFMLYSLLAFGIVLTFLEYINYTVVTKIFHNNLSRVTKTVVQNWEEEYRATFMLFQNSSDAAAETMQETNQLTKIINKANKTEDFKSAHDELYNKFLPLYNNLKTHSISIMQVHDAKGNVLIRFQKPEKYADNVLSYLKVVTQTHTTHKKTFGFEEGQFFNGYRFVYPLFDNGIFIGSLQLGTEELALNTNVNDAYSLYTYIALFSKSHLIKNEAVDPSVILPYEFVHHKSYPKAQLNLLTELSKADPQISENMHLGKTASSAVQIGNNYYIISIEPFKNFQNKTIGVKILYYPSPSLVDLYASYKLELLFSSMMVMLLAMLFFYLIERYLKTKKTLDINKIELDSVVQKANAIVAVIDNEGRMLHLNEYGLKYVGYTQEEISSIPYFWNRFLGEKNIDLAFQVVQTAKSGFPDAQHQNPWIRHDGVARMFEWTYSTVYNIDGSLQYFFKIGIDIEERIDAQWQILESKEKFESVFRLSRDGIAILDLETNFLDFNDAYMHILDISREELLTKSCRELTVPEDLKIVDTAAIELLNKGVLDNFQKRCLKKDGSYVTVLMSAALTSDKKRIILTAKDMTSQLEKERMLIQRDAYLAMAIDNANAVIWKIDIRTNEIWFLNDTVFGYPAATLHTTEKFFSHIYDQDRVEIQQKFEDFIISEEMSSFINYRFVSQDGKVLYLHVALAKHKIDDENFDIIGIITDITRIEESKRALELTNISVEATSDAMYWISSQGNIIKANHGASVMLGYANDELLNMKIHDINAEFLDATTWKVHFEKIKEAKTIYLEAKHLHKDGQKIPVGVHITYMQYENEEIAMGIVRDLSEQKEYEHTLLETKNRLEETLKEQAAILEVKTTGFTHLKDRKLIWVNEALEQMFGYEKGEMNGQSTRIMYSDNAEYEQYGADGYAELQKNGVYTGEFKGIKKDGSPITILASMTALSRESKEAIGVCIDITKNKENELALELAKEHADAANKAKSEFLANMSHEIRTPLNGIIGLNRLMLNTELDARQKEYSLKSLQSSQALLEIINDILDYSKIEAGKLEISSHPFSLEKLLHNTTNLFEYAVSQKSVELHIDLDPDIPAIVEGDSLRLSQILNNLVGNGVKFTNVGDILIHVKRIKTVENTLTLEFSVSDTGIGMSEEETSNLFQAFTQTDNSNSRKYGGTGLGLVISKNLVNLMGGDIWFESKKGFGTTFYFTAELSLVENSKTIQHLEKLKNSIFMIVDDNAVEREVLTHILHSWGVKPIVCDNGADALKIAQNQHIDYLLIDWKMPELDGLDVIEKLSKHNIKDFPKIIMINAHSKEDLLQKTKERDLHPDEILHKPITQSTLLEALHVNDETSNNHESDKDEQVEFNGKILVVEDNEVNQLVIHDLLENYGFTVDIANNGAEAIQICLSRNYDLILMDLQMPEIDGFEATRAIRSFNNHTPIIALSAAAMLQDKEQAQEAGMNAHLSKPVDIKELTKMFKHYLPYAYKSSNSSDVSSTYIEGVETEKLIELLGSHEKMTSILKTFYITQRNFCEKLSAVEIMDDKFKTLIHSLKGVSGSIFAQELYDLCVKIELNLEQKNVSSLVFNLCEVHKNVMTAIGNFLEKKNVIDVIQKANTKEVIQIIEDIESTLKENAHINSEKLENFKKNVQPYCGESLSTQFEEAIMVFDFESALSVLDRIKESIDE